MAYNSNIRTGIIFIVVLMTICLGLLGIKFIRDDDSKRLKENLNGERYLLKNESNPQTHPNAALIPYVSNCSSHSNYNTLDTIDFEPSLDFESEKVFFIPYAPKRPYKSKVPYESKAAFNRKFSLTVLDEEGERGLSSPDEEVYGRVPLSSNREITRVKRDTSSATTSSVPAGASKDSTQYTLLNKNLDSESENVNYGYSLVKKEQHPNNSNPDLDENKPIHVSKSKEKLLVKGYPKKMTKTLSLSELRNAGYLKKQNKSNSKYSSTPKLSEALTEKLYDRLYHSQDRLSGDKKEVYCGFRPGPKNKSIETVSHLCGKDEYTRIPSRCKKYGCKQKVQLVREQIQAIPLRSTVHH